MLDAGVEMEPDLRQVLTAMSGQQPSEWDAAALGRISRQTIHLQIYGYNDWYVEAMKRRMRGRDYHTGGSFPMRAQPARFESDRWGRPAGFERVHVVDATVFPSIPAGPITFTVMANAQRIASECLHG